MVPTLFLSNRLILSRPETTPTPTLRKTFANFCRHFFDPAPFPPFSFSFYFASSSSSSFSPAFAFLRRLFLTVDVTTSCWYGVDIMIKEREETGVARYPPFQSLYTSVLFSTETPVRRKSQQLPPYYSVARKKKWRMRRLLDNTDYASMVDGRKMV